MSDLDRYLKRLFDDNDHVNVCVDSVFETDTVLSHEVSTDSKWVCVNPLNPFSSRKQSNLSAYRNFVIEYDGAASPEQQMDMAQQYCVPYSTAVFSGNKSVHFVIALEKSLESLDEYREYANRIKKALHWADAACLEPARLTRCPNSDQPLMAAHRRITKSELDRWLSQRGALVPEKPTRTSTVSGFGILSKRTLQLISGMVAPSEAHRAVIHAAKNMFEIGLNYDEVLLRLTQVRMKYRPEETFDTARSKTDRLVSWVYQEWEMSDGK